MNIDVFINNSVDLIIIVPYEIPTRNFYQFVLDLATKGRDHKIKTLNETIDARFIDDKGHLEFGKYKLTTFEFTVLLAGIHHACLLDDNYNPSWKKNFYMAVIAGIPTTNAEESKFLRKMAGIYR